jgi:HSP20 family protein
MAMALVKHDESKHQDESKHEVETRRHDFFDQFFENWSDALRPVVFWPGRVIDTMRVEEFSENGAHVIRAELPGLDPDKDLEIAVVGDMLQVDAQRREDEKKEGRDYVRREYRYGSYHREFPLPKGISQEDIEASYKDGILEVRIPILAPEPKVAKKIPVTAR